MSHNYSRSDYIDQLFESVECVIDVMIEGEKNHPKDSWKDSNSNNGTIENHIIHASNHLCNVGNEKSYKHNLENLSHAAARSLMALQLFLERTNEQK